MPLYEQLLREHRLFKRAISEEATPEDTLTYASGQDSSRHYSKNQERWKAFSVEVMNELIGNISQNTGEFSIFEPRMSNGPQGDSDFENIFRFCSRKRAEIAKELEHSKAEQFGDFRGEGFRSREFLYGDPNESKAWKNVQCDVFNAVISLIEEIPDQKYETNSGGEKTYDSTYIYVTRKEKIVTATQKENAKSEDDFIYYMIEFKTPNFESEATNDNGYNHLLSIIYFEHYPECPKKNRMAITYADINRHDQQGNFSIANYYYHNLMLMSTDTIEERKEFLKELGRLNHFMAHILPVKRGNSSICEWITRSVAHKKGIELGEFNQDEPLPWDFKALVTPDKEAYADWYANKAFLDMVVASGPQNTSSLSL